MQIINGLENLTAKLENTVVTVGNFDGVHIGHQALLSATRERARANGGISVAVTFYPHPAQVLSPTGAPPLLTVRRRKEELIAAQGIDILLTIMFTRDFAKVSARKFITDILINRLGMKTLIMGFDSSIGKGREGSVDKVKEIGRKLGFEVLIVDRVSIDNKKISSTRAREMIQNGMIGDVIEHLGRPYQISGRVVQGFRRGDKILGYPTANLQLYNEVTPAYGVYAVRVTLGDGKKVKGVTNVGVNPTFQNKNLSVETFLLDYDGDLYDQFIRLDFIERLRPEMKFPNPQALAEQITKDIARAREILK